MIKRLTKMGTSYGIVIDRAILDLLRIDPETPIELATDGTVLTLRPRHDLEARTTMQPTTTTTTYDRSLIGKAVTVITTAPRPRADRRETPGGPTYEFSGLLHAIEDDGSLVLMHNDRNVQRVQAGIIARVVPAARARKPRA